MPQYNFLVVGLESYIIGQIANLYATAAFTLPDGTVIRQRNFVDKETGEVLTTRNWMYFTPTSKKVIIANYYS